MNIILLVAGLVLVLVGANYLTEGASDLAKRMRISEFVIGVTVVAIGTSTPELVVSFMSALEGKGDLAVGNVLGSNLFNILIILGITTLIMPLQLTRDTLRKDVLFGLLASVVLLIVASDTFLDKAPANYIGRNEGLLMLCFFLIFIFYTLYAVQDKNRREKRTDQAPVVVRKWWLSLVMLIGGLAALVYGGDLFLDSAIVLARNMGISESVIAVTLLAGGTSLPELSASVVSAIKKKPGIALGNVLGSNITNIFLVLGLSATAAPLTTQGILMEDLVFLIAVSLLVFLSA